MSITLSEIRTIKIFEMGECELKFKNNFKKLNLNQNLVFLKRKRKMISNEVRKAMLHFMET